jgi:methionyl-tRNA synthetase
VYAVLRKTMRQNKDLEQCADSMSATVAPAIPDQVMTEKFYITTPIFYPNDVPHIGHAYTAIATDVLARFARLDGKDVFFLTGTDEHGQKMQQTATKAGLTPMELADKNSAVFRQMMQTLNCSNDDFIRTTEERHKVACQALWNKMVANGDIYLGKYGGWYSVRQEAYFDEGETTVGPDKIRREPLGSPVEWVEEESYYFKLSAYGEKLLKLYESNPGFVQPAERRNEVASFVKSGLRDVSVSRTTFDWGIKVPDADGHVMYVWVDALTNYITAAGYPDEHNAKWFYWPAMHIIGKDIVRFHAVYWPAFLMSAGVELPKRVFAHGFVLNDGEKMSKSVGNVIDPFELIEQFGLDKVRYFLMREIPFGQDGSCNHDSVMNRTNADLANDLGNLAQRSLSMIAKNCEGRVPVCGGLTDADSAMLKLAAAACPAARLSMDGQAIHTALAAIFDVVSEANRYFASQEPWALRKSDIARMNTVLFVTAEVLRQVGILAQPFMPGSAAKLLELLAVPDGQRRFEHLHEDYQLAAGTPLPAPDPVFPRYVEKSQDGQ